MRWCREKDLHIGTLNSHIQELKYEVEQNKVQFGKVTKEEKVILRKGEHVSSISEENKRLRGRNNKFRRTSNDLITELIKLRTELVELRQTNK